MWYRTRQTEWQSLGGALLSNPTAVTFDGVTYVFGVGLDDAVWYRTPHTGWASLGGVIVSDLGVTTDGSGLYVTGIGLDDAIWSLRMTGSTWHSWESLGGRVDQCTRDDDRRRHRLRLRHRRRRSRLVPRGHGRHVEWLVRTRRNRGVGGGRHRP